MKRTFYTLLVLAFSVTLSSCDNDFDITADYQDHTIVYGLLNQDSTTYIKINKAFLGNENALVMAKIEDSSVYTTGLDAKLEEWSGESLIKTLQLEPTQINNKEEGIFYNPYQIVYFTNEPLNTSSIYRLNIMVNNKQVTAETSLIPDFYSTRPRAGSAYIKFLDNPDVFSVVEWEAPANGKHFQVKIRFNYREKSFNHTDSVNRYFDWGIGSYTADETEGGELFELTYKPDQFYDMCLNNIPYKDAALESEVSGRVPVSVDFIISVADNELYTYMDVNQSGGGISQVVPEYTNIDNGLGLFASRYYKITSKLLDLESYQTLEELNIKF